MDRDHSFQRDRAALAVLERFERRLHLLSRRIFHAAGIAAALTFVLCILYLLDFLGEGFSVGAAALIASATVMVTLYPTVFLIEAIEKSLAKQIAEVSR